MKLIAVRVATFMISPTETGWDDSSPDLFCFKMSQIDTLNSHEASVKQRQKDISGRGST